MERYAVAYSIARSLLDPSSTGQGPYSGAYTDAYLARYMPLALRGLRRVVGSNHVVAVVNQIAVINAVPAGTTDFGNYIRDGQPLGQMVEPISVYEKPAGSDDANYTLVEQMSDVPLRDPMDKWYECQFRAGNIYGAGATQALDFRVTFETLWVENPQDGTQLLPATDIADILGILCAEAVCLATGDPKLAAFAAESEERTYLWLNDKVKMRQGIMVSQKPMNSQPVLRYPGIQ